MRETSAPTVLVAIYHSDVMTDAIPPINPCVVLTTVGDREEGDRIAQALISENLAACVNLVPITSVYRWEGKVCNDEEIQLVIKTDLNRFDQVQARITELHSYDLPEIIALPIAKGSEGYLDWMVEQLRI